VQLAAKIASLKEQLQNEKKRNQQNEEMIRELQAQIEDLLLTMEVAENAKTA
jgi:capsule polysaccharide export protein KpsE/RkpR